MVLTQDRAAIVLNKPPGLATQGGSGTKEHVDGLLDAFAAEGPRPRLVHRLDKDTSGVLLIARTPGSAAFFSKRFSDPLGAQDLLGAGRRRARPSTTA